MAPYSDMYVVSVTLGAEGKLTLKPSSRLTKSIHSCARTGVAESKTSAAATLVINRIMDLELNGPPEGGRYERRLASSGDGPPIVQCQPSPRDPVDEPQGQETQRNPDDDEPDSQRHHHERATKARPQQSPPERANLPAEVRFQPRPSYVAPLHVVEDHGDDRGPPDEKRANHRGGPENSRQQAQRVQSVDDLGPGDQRAFVVHRVRASPRGGCGRCQAPIHGFDEHIRGPVPSSGAVARVVVERGPRRLHLLKRHLLCDHRLNTIADDGDHIAVLEHIEFV